MPDKNDELKMIEGAAILIARRPHISESESDLALLVAHLAALLIELGP